MEPKSKINNIKSEINNEHDKVFKELFVNKNEAVYFLNRVLNLKLQADEIERYTNSFVTSGYKYKEADCVYKLKNKRIFFVLEHQSVVDYRMPYRMLNYQAEIMRSCETYKNVKNNREALVMGIVLYTGKSGWTAEKYIRSIQYMIKDGTITILGDNKTLGNYTVVDVNKYDDENLLRDKSLISKVMLIEKTRKTEELARNLFKMVKHLDKKGLKYIRNLIKNILVNDLSTETRKVLVNCYDKAIKEGGEENMELAVVKTIRDDLAIHEKIGEKRGERRGERRGEKRGIELGKLKIAKRMLKENYTIKEIVGITELSKKKVKELENKINNNE